LIKEGRATKKQTPKIRKSTNEIRALLANENIDFDLVLNKALNAYLPKIFPVCPFTSDLCIQGKHCLDCDSYRNEQKAYASEHKKT
jgi:hypothetical protein